MERLRQLIHEIHRRSLWQVLGIYLVASWAVLQIVDTLGDALRLPEWIEPVAFVLLIIGLPIVLATAFVQEGGPGRQAKDVATPTADAPTSAQGLFTWRNALGGGVLAFALWGVVAAGWVLLGDGPSSEVEERPAIAVLPFENMSGEPEDEYFTDGMHDEILTRLSKIAGLRVISRTSVLGYENPTRNLREIARELGVAYIGEGAVRRAQNEVRITVQLIDAETDEHLWAETYDRELSPGAIFDIQSDVAQRIAEALRAELTPEERARVAVRPTDSQEAYDLYLLALSLVSAERSLDVIDALRDAVELDPQFTEAWALLASVHIFRWWRSAVFERTEERRAMAEAALEQAEELDSDNIEYLATLAAYNYYILEDYERAEELYEGVIEREPNHGFAWSQIGYARRRLGNFEGAVEAFAVGERLDPRFWQTRSNRSITLSLLGRWDEANAVVDRMHLARPDVLDAWAMNGTIRYRQGDLEGAREDAMRALDTGHTGTRAEEELVRILVAERRFEEALSLLQTARLWTDRPSSFEPKALWAARIQDFMGRSVEARESYQAAQVYLEERMAQEDPVLPRTWSALGLTLAGLGEGGSAIEAGRRAVQINPIAQDAIGGTLYLDRLARIYTTVGESEAALDLIEDLLDRPSFLTVERLQGEPDWDPLRDHPRFQALVGN